MSQSDAPSNPLALRTLTVALAIAVGLLLFPYVSGLIGAMVLYVVTAPVMRRAAAIRQPRVAAFAIVFVLFFVLIVPGVWLLVELVGEIPDAARTLERSAAVRRLMAMHIGAIDVGAQLAAASADMVRWSSRQTLAAVGGIMSATLNLIIALFGAYYLLVAGDALWEWLKGMLPFASGTAERLRIRFHRVTEAMLLGVALSGVAQGALVGISFALVGFDHALFWAAVTAAASILPIFGSALVWLPGTLILFAEDRYTAAIALGTFGTLVISNIDNALRLIVFRRVSHVHPMVTLVGAFGGVRVLGIAGLLLGPLMLSYAIELARIAGHREPVAPRAATRRGIPLATPTESPTSEAGVHM